MTNKDEIAEDAHGRFAGAVKQFDTNDVLNDEQIDAYATAAAEAFAEQVVDRCSDYQIDELTE